MSDRAEMDRLIEEVKARMSMLDVLALEGLPVRRSGGNYVVCCPFHGERSPSFTIHGPDYGRGHCYGCGWDGDVIDFWRGRRGGGLLDALRALASLASLPAAGCEWRKRRQAAQVPLVTGRARAEKEKPALPRMRALRNDEVRDLAALRGLGVDGIAAACRDKRVGFCRWSQFIDRDCAWRMAKDAADSWVVTDSARWVAQFRRLDGEAYKIKRENREDEIKAWTKGSPSWPLGAGEMGGRMPVILVEGGADMLAAYHFLWLFGRLDAVAVVAMLGASNRIAEGALKFFARRRVRIIMDEDEAKGERGIRAGAEAAARWTEQLTGAGAAVETFSLEGLTRRNGAAVKDLNDLADAERSVWMAPDVREAFFDFDF